MTASQILIRDGVKADIPRCIQLDDSYHTEYVWQMTMNDDNDQMNVIFRKQRLPRPMDAHHLSSAKRLERALSADQCFIVISNDNNEIFGYMTMQVNAVNRLAYLQDIVIDHAYRRQNLGSRLLHIAQQWASEKSLHKIIAEIPTTNYPTIQFCQSHGFTFCGFNDQYLPTQDIAVFFCLPL